MTTRRTIDDFWKIVDRSGGPDSCWPWLRSGNSGGYGLFTMSSVSRVAHQWAWIFTYGAIEGEDRRRGARGTIVRHRCDNRLCCNPTHLELGTHLENARDRMNRGRSRPRRGEENGLHKLTDERVKDLRTRYSAGESQQSIADDFGVSQVAVSLVLRHRTWRHVK